MNVPIYRELARRVAEQDVRIQYIIEARVAAGFAPAGPSVEGTWFGAVAVAGAPAVGAGHLPRLLDAPLTAEAREPVLFCFLHRYAEQLILDELPHLLG